MTTATRLDTFEADDRTALICVNDPHLQSMLIDNVAELGFKIHTGISSTDLELKLRSHAYDLLVISDLLESDSMASNRVLQSAIDAPSANRHRQFIALLGKSFITADESQAFVHSVDLVFDLSQIAHFKPVLKRMLVKTREFYAPLREALHAVGSE